MSDAPRVSAPLPGEPSPGGGATPRDPVLILFLNLFGFAAVGYWLLGQRGKAILGLVFFLALGVKTCFAGSLLLAMIAAMDGYLQARQRLDGRQLGNWTFFDGHV